MNTFVSRLRAVLVVCALFLVGSLGNASAASFDRKDITFVSQGLKCAAWYYVPNGLKEGEKRPAIVMAHGFTGVKEMYLDNFASKFAEAGFVVTVFDYRYFGGSEGEPRSQLFYYQQHEDYRNAITWTSMQKEVDPERIGIWGTSYSGGHVMVIGAFDKRVKAVVSQVPVTNVWEAYLAPMKPEALAGAFAWHKQGRIDKANGKVNYFPAVAKEGEPGVMGQEAYDWFMTDVEKRAPSYRNQVTVESLEIGMSYDPTATLHLLSPAPFLMIIASDDVITPTELEKKAFERAKDPKKLIVVPGRHFDAYHGAKHDAFALPAVEWFEQHLKP